MTIKDIAEKYGVTYNITYQATYGVKPITTGWRDREYDEGPVVKNVKAILQERIEKHLKKAAELQEMLDGVKERSKTE